MYELKKIGKVFTSKFVGTGRGPRLIKKFPGRGLTKFEKHCSTAELFFHSVALLHGTEFNQKYAANKVPHDMRGFRIGLSPPPPQKKDKRKRKVIDG
jgi:hypothetical protein